jgi:hypothetical protein
MPGGRRRDSRRLPGSSRTYAAIRERRRGCSSVDPSLGTRHRARLRQQYWLVERPVESKGMFQERRNPGGQDDTALRRAREDVTTGVRASLEPVRVVERPGAHPEKTRKPLEGEIQRRPAAATEVDVDALPAPIGAVIVRSSCRSRKHDGPTLEDRFDQERGSGELLAKGAVADGRPDGVAGRGVANLTAQTATFVNHRHGTWRGSYLLRLGIAPPGHHGLSSERGIDRKGHDRARSAPAMMPLPCRDLALCSDDQLAHRRRRLRAPRSTSQVATPDRAVFDWMLRQRAWMLAAFFRGADRSSNATALCSRNVTDAGLSLKPLIHVSPAAKRRPRSSCYARLIGHPY